MYNVGAFVLLYNLKISILNFHINFNRCLQIQYVGDYVRFVTTPNFEVPTTDYEKLNN